MKRGIQGPLRTTMSYLKKKLSKKKRRNVSQRRRNVSVACFHFAQFRRNDAQRFCSKKTLLHTLLHDVATSTRVARFVARSRERSHGGIRRKVTWGAAVGMPWGRIGPPWARKGGAQACARGVARRRARYVATSKQFGELHG